VKRPVEGDHKIRISREIETAVPWLASERQLTCLAVLSPVVGLLILPDWDATAHERRARLEQIRQLQLRPDEAGADVAQLARYYAESWPISIAKEDPRFTITALEEIRELGHLPGEGGQVYVYGHGGILEISEASEWLANQRRTAKALSGMWQATLLKDV
jgi:hypothetical protein